ncbi:uncharacterized protein LOC110980618 [Acanthaster planci]|uniref:Uncharacterized protein LOC110980618 n=1 Tax=Acanthaster planci TaxID=133434 RepID=A0A8B7YKK9_ACAPL|nr:uncharacterized protein LOC110980618 [Acanthaster planci]
MGARFIVLIFVAMATQSAWALKCYQCSTFIYPRLPLPNDGRANCANSPPPSAYRDPGTCGGSLLGPSNTCVTISGTVRGTTAGGSSLSFNDGTFRGCTTLIGTNPQCFQGEKAEHFAKMLLELSSFSSFKGSVCFCKGDYCNGVSAVRPLAAVIVLVIAAKQFFV